MGYADPLTRATLEAAEPYDPDYWVPGYRYRESLALLCGLPLPGTTSGKPRGKVVIEDCGQL